MDPENDFDLESLDAKLQRLTIVAGVKHTKTNEDGPRGNPYGILCVCQEEGTMNTAPPGDPVSSDSGGTELAQPKRKLAFRSLHELPQDEPAEPSAKPSENEDYNDDSSISSSSVKVQVAPTKKNVAVKTPAKPSHAEATSSSTVLVQPEEPEDDVIADLRPKKRKA
ncbi:unnamed protein product [Cuscuta epithymum]|uniref:Uncharacterized protein n=1 Tax=Cuscuta epithymum TaxID=186058 RepID=A0AAV0F6T7_9ASTE|nr:unnamed protein product [Cuscuta epithymum]